MVNLLKDLLNQLHVASIPFYNPAFAYPNLLLLPIHDLEQPMIPYQVVRVLDDELEMSV